MPYTKVATYAAKMMHNADLDANDTTAKDNLGIVRYTDDGRAFRYVKMTGGALAYGQLVTQAANVTFDNITTSTATDGRANSKLTPASFSATPGQYEGYFVYIKNGTGEGQLRRVVSNDASSVTIDFPLTTATAATDDGFLIPPPWFVIISAVNTKTQRTVGVGVGAIAQNSYGWVQVGGIAPVIFTTAPTAGNSVVPGGATTAGQAAIGTTAKGAFDENTIGYVVAASASANLSSAVQLQNLF